jgi:hypothetical protein
MTLRETRNSIFLYGRCRYPNLIDKAIARGKKEVFIDLKDLQ